jgi:hypothetical protein
MKCNVYELVQIFSPIKMLASFRTMYRVLEILRTATCWQILSGGETQKGHIIWSNNLEVLSQMFICVY